MKRLYVLLLFALIICDLQLFAQGGVSVGKGNMPANQKAIFEIVSQNKGLLIPRMTTPQRTSIFSGEDLTAIGLLVFDSNLNSFFYWTGSAWKDISTPSSSITEISLDSQKFLTIKEGDNVKTVDLCTLSVAVKRFNGVPTGTAMDCQLGYNTITKTFYIFDSNTWIPLNQVSDSQDLTLTGNVLSLTNDPTSVNLSMYLDNTDAQNLKSVLDQGTDADGRKITNLGDPTLAQDAATKNYVDNSISASGGGNMTKAVYDTNNNSIIDNTEKVNGYTVNTAVPSNALFTDDQTLSISGTTLYLTRGGSVNIPSTGGTDSQILSVAGTTLSISGGNSVTLPAGGGDMLKATYDTNLDNVVDNAARVNNLTVLTAVPAGAVFTDAQTITLTGEVTGTGTGSFAATIANNAVTNAKVLDGAINSAKIMDGTIVNADLNKTNIPLSGFAAASADVSMGTFKITNLATPTANTDAATKKYVDDTVGAGGGGDMMKTTYDTDNNGVVDNSTRVNNLTVLTAVPAGAVFTDSQNLSILGTTLSIAGGNSITLPSGGDMLKAAYDTNNDGIVDNATRVNNLTVLTAVPAGAVFTDAQTITLTGEVTGTGTGSFAATIANNAVTTTKVLDGAINSAKIMDGTIANADLNKTAIPLSGFGAAAANVSMGTNKITSLAAPTADTDAATKKYVDDSVGAAGGGDITGVTAGTGLSGGATVGDATLNLTNTTVTAGAYTSANITVDAQGRITAAANGTGGATNLGYTSSPTNGIVTSSTGTNATVIAGSTTNASLMLPADKTKLDKIADIVTPTDANKVLTVNAGGTAATWVTPSGGGSQTYFSGVALIRASGAGVTYARVAGSNVATITIPLGVSLFYVRINENYTDIGSQNLFDMNIVDNNGTFNNSASTIMMPLLQFVDRSTVLFMGSSASLPYKPSQSFMIVGNGVSANTLTIRLTGASSYTDFSVIMSF